MKRKVCCFLESWDFGGIEALITDILTAENVSDLKIDVIAARISKNAYSDRLEKIGVRFIELTGRLRSLENFPRFASILKAEGYDAIHFNIFHGVALNYVRIAKKLGVKTRIIHAHGAGLRKSATKPLKMLLHNFCKLIFKNIGTDYLACSHNAAKFLHGNTPASIVNNGIRTEAFRFCPPIREAMREALGIQDELLAGHVGRLSSEKNQAFVLEVFKGYHSINPASHLVFLGDGPMKDEYESYAETLGISSSVSFLGIQNNTSEWLSAMDFFIFPSVVEGLGIAAIEAQASGLYALCSESLPPEAAVSDRFIPLPITSTEIWVNKMLELPLPSNRELYADTVKGSGFDISDTVCKILALYRGEKL